MSNLEIFLIEEGYCNTEREAIKILECISDEFYDFLIEKTSEYDPGRYSPERVIAMTARIRELQKQAQNNPESITDPVKFRQRIKKIKDALPKNQIMRELELKRRIKEKEAKPGILPTPRGKDGSIVQKPQVTRRGGTSEPNIVSGSSRELDKIATGLTGMPSEVGRAGGASAQSTSVRVTGGHTNMSPGGGATSKLPNSTMKTSPYPKG
jgi:hypothetical protein